MHPLHPVVVFWEGSLPAGTCTQGPRGTRAGAACPRVGHAWLPQAFLSSLTPGPCAFMDIVHRC